MKIDSHNKKHFFFAMDFKVFNSDTGKEIPKVIWADVEKGEYCQYRINPDGTVYYEKGMTELIREIHRANIELRAR